MNMGGPGDHWLTDLTRWKDAVFGEPYDAVLRDILVLGGERLLSAAPWEGRLWTAYPATRGAVATLAPYLAELSELRDRLRREATDRGWDAG